MYKGNLRDFKRPEHPIKTESQAFRLKIPENSRITTDAWSVGQM